MLCFILQHFCFSGLLYYNLFPQPFLTSFSPFTYHLLHCFIKISPYNFSCLSSLLFSLPANILGDIHGHALIGLEPSGYLSDDIGRFSEILTPANVGARQEVLNQTHSDVITPVRESERGRKAEK